MCKEPKQRPVRKVTKKSKSEVNGNKEPPNLSEEENDNSTIRCPCGDNSDKGMMIQCETCLVWQHSICVGIREDKAVPSHYFCEICLPRNFKCLCGENTVSGKFIECGECSTWQHVKCLGKSATTLGKSYRCPNCVPQDFVATPKLLKRKDQKKMSNQAKNFSFITSDYLREMFEKDFLSLYKAKENQEKVGELLPSKQEVMEKYCIKFCDATQEHKMECYELLKGISILLDCNIDTAKEWFEEILQDMIEMHVDVKEISDPMEGWTEIKSNNDSKVKTILTENWGKDMSQHLDFYKTNNQLGLLMKQNVAANQFLVEYLGNVLLMKDWDRSNLIMEERIRVLRTNRVMNDSTVCIDARTCGNKSRFIRRSCTSNAIVKFLEIEQDIHAGIFAKNIIESNTEITIDFDGDWMDSKHLLNCPCNLENCKVDTWFKHRQSRAKQVLSDMKSLSFSSDTDESEEEVKRKKRKKIVTLSPSRLDRSSKKSNDEEEPEIQSIPTEKMSREERKIAMLMKSFQKMENRQNRKRRSEPEKKKD